MSAELILHLILWPPLAGFLINGILGTRLPKSVVSAVACLAPLASFAGTCLAYVHLRGESTTIDLFTWFTAGGATQVNFGFFIDHLTLVMLFVITGVGSLIHIYSTGYMHHDKGYARYFSYLNLFLFSMLMLVLGSNLLILFVGWEGVGLCSFLLIGFWYENKEFNKAAVKAFIMNRIGDFAFLLGIILCLYNLGTVTFVRMQQTIGEAGGINDPRAVMITLLLFIGACGKSAQIPLFTWLPDAMAGPTPVSALIHAATMVTAGIYMIARMFFLYEICPYTLNIIAIIGCATALIAASIALKQNDIKKILAYSTVSQLGYMVVALGVGAYITAIFHLVTHAFFKALLFLGAGSVIHGLNGEQDISKMGGLKSKMKWTYVVMLLGTLAIVGCPPFAGFFSKDEILAVAYHKSFWYFLVLAFASVFTAWYMFRLFYSCFHGKYRGSPGSEHHIHESPWNMLIPLILLAVLSVVGGLIGMPETLHQTHYFYKFVVQAVTIPKHEATHFFEYSLWGMTVLALSVIAFACYKLYTKKSTEEYSSPGNALANLLKNKYYLDEIYDFLIVNPLKRVGFWFGNVMEYKVIDRMVRFPDVVLSLAGNSLKNIQSGKLSWYLLSSAIGILLVLLMFIFKIS